MSENTQDALWRARELAPQVVPIRAMLAMSLAGTGDFDHAMAVLWPVRNAHLSKQERKVVAALAAMIEARAVDSDAPTLVRTLLEDGDDE